MKADVLIEYGLIKTVAASNPDSDLPKDCIMYDARGRPLTSGIIDMHSHAGDYSLPDLVGNSDGNEVSSPVTPYVRAIDAINVLDPQIQVIKSGGVTTSLILPGSGNNIGGEAYLIKHAVGKEQGRPELSVASLLADPERTWRYMKMACGENPKRVYGKFGERGPFSRMGESWEFRKAFASAADLIRQQDDWCSAAAAHGLGAMSTYLPVDLELEALAAVLRGQVHVNTHCYTIVDLESFVDHTLEFNFSVRAFHHAHQTYLVPEVLHRAWGDTPPAAALFADNMYYKAEAYIGSEYAGRDLWEAGITPLYVSDNPVLNAQHVLFAAAKAYRWGLPYHVALASVTSAPAERLGMGQRLGKVKPGFDADVVVWDSDPLSVGAAPVQVWIDGMAQFEDPVVLAKSFEPIEPDVSLAQKPQDVAIAGDVVFAGVRRVLLDDHEDVKTEGSSVNVVVHKGEIRCVGACEDAIATASAAGARAINLKNGYLTHSLTAFGSTLGMSEIDAEQSTQNGWGNFFSRAVDGLALDTKKLHEAAKYGVTKAISAPYIHSTMSHHGTSVGFLTGGLTTLDKRTVFADDVAVHYTLTPNARQGVTPSISSLIDALRRALLQAVEAEDTVADAYSEAAFLQKVVRGELPLAITVHSADVIAAILKVKQTVEDRIAVTPSATSKPPKLRLILIGAGEAHLVATDLNEAGVGVVLAPYQSFVVEWDTRRSLPGAPLTNGTSVDVLVDAGITMAIGLHEDWTFRSMILSAGVAYVNGQGKFDERTAMDLVSANIYKILGIEQPKGHFVISEGSPLEIGSRIKGIGSGLGYTTVFT